MRLLDAIREYIVARNFELCAKSLPNDIKTLLHFAVFMRDKDVELESIRLQDVHLYVNLLLEAGFNKNTAFRKANSFKQFFDFYIKQGYRVINPDLLPKIKMAHHRPRVATEEEYRQLIAAIPADGKYFHVRNLSLFSLLYDSFARVNEILPMKTSWIQNDCREAVIKTEKVFDDEDERRIFWRDETRENLLRWLDLREKILIKKNADDDGTLFITTGGGNCEITGKYRQLTYVGLKDWARDYSVKAGLARVLNPHSLRHKGAVEMAENDYDPYVIAATLGHKSIESALNYTRLYGDRLRRKYYQIKR